MNAMVCKLWRIQTQQREEQLHECKLKEKALSVQEILDFIMDLLPPTAKNHIRKAAVSKILKQYDSSISKYIQHEEEEFICQFLLTAVNDVLKQTGFELVPEEEMVQRENVYGTLMCILWELLCQRKFLSWSMY
jgi:hypothetical protein